MGKKGEEGPSSGPRMVSFQIPAEWMPWIEQERVKRGLRTRSDFLRVAVRENIVVLGRTGTAGQGVVITVPPTKELRVTKITGGTQGCVKRAVEYFARRWNLDQGLRGGAVQLATRTFLYLKEREGLPANEGPGATPTAEEKRLIANAAATAVKAKLGEIAVTRDHFFGEIPEIVIEVDITEELEVLFAPSAS